MKPTFSITVAKKRDILSAQVRARQLCRMLGFDPLEQARVVCLIFELISSQLERGPVILSLRVQDRQFQVLSSAANAPRGAVNRRPSLRLALSLPLPPATLAVDDVFWAMDRIQVLSRPDLFAEIRQQNNDLLRALSALQGASSPAVPSASLAGAA